jgi:hypothetical protein
VFTYLEKLFDVIQALFDGGLEERMDHLGRKKEPALALNLELGAVICIVFVNQLLQSQVLHNLQDGQHPDIISSLNKKAMDEIENEKPSPP